MKTLNAVPENIVEVKKVLLQGGVAVCPTDTVYGFIAHAGEREAVKKIFRIKERDISKPLAVFIRDFEAVENLAEINETQREFLKKVWPGKVTAVCAAKSLDFPEYIISSDGKMGLRMPDYEFLNQLLSVAGFPLAQTSANISGSPASGNIGEIMLQLEKFSRKPDLILDAGNLPESLPSTVIDLTTSKILREGAVSEEHIFGLLDLIS